METKNKFFLFFIIVLFCMLTSYNLYSWKYYIDLNSLETDLNNDIEELKNLTNNTIMLEKIEKIERKVKFQQMLLLGDITNGTITD